MVSKLEKKELIIKKSRELFSEIGYEETKVEDITKALGISKGSFYTYFNSKEEVLNEILKILKDEYIEMINRIDTSKSPKEIMEKYFFLKIEAFITNFYKINNQNLLKIMKNPEVCKARDEIRNIGKEFLIENVVKRLENPDYDPEFITKYIKTSVEEYFWSEIIENRIGDRQTYLQRKEKEMSQIINFIYDGLTGNRRKYGK